MKKLVMIFTLLAALLVASVTALAAPSLVDDAGVLTEAEREQVLAELQKQEKLYGVRLGVVSVEPIAGGMSDNDLGKALLQTGYTNGKNGGMVLLLVRTGSGDALTAMLRPMPK